MRAEYTLSGKDYSINKNDFKKILAKYGLKWKGDMKNAIWGNEQESVRGIYIRDNEKDITISAILIWEGTKKTEFFAEFDNWIRKINPESGGRKQRSIIKSDILNKIEEELRMWDLIHKPDTIRMKASGRPNDWIKKDIDNYKKERNEFKKNLQNKYGSDID